MAGLEAPWELMGSSSERGRRGGRRRGGRGARLGGGGGHDWEGPWGEGCRGAREAAWLPSIRPVRAACCACVREKKRGRKERRKEKEGKEKRKNMKFFLNLKIYKK
jgi:hypothetical protein